MVSGPVVGVREEVARLSLLFLIAGRGGRWWEKGGGRGGGG